MASDEFIEWCRRMEIEPFICLNMGTGTLEEALAWVEYCNRYASLWRSKYLLKDAILATVLPIRTTPISGVRMATKNLTA